MALTRWDKVTAHTPAGDEDMKLRLIVMNGHRLVESQRDGKWHVEKVDKANGLTPYIYNLFMAEPADKTQQYGGVALYADRQFVYQIFRKGFVRRDPVDFELAPTYGERVRIAYKKGKASVSVMVPKHAAHQLKAPNKAQIYK
jgi:hypothetical protein